MLSDEVHAVADLGHARHEHDEDAVSFQDGGDVGDAQVRGGHVEDSVGEERLDCGAGREEGSRSACLLLLCDPVLHVADVEVDISGVDSAAEPADDLLGVGGEFRGDVYGVDDGSSVGAPGIPLLLLSLLLG